MRIHIVYGAREPARAGGLLEALARNSFAVSVGVRSKQVQGLLAERGCDLLLLGQTLADEDGLTFLKALRSRGPTRQLPVVALLDNPEAPVALNHREGGSAAARPQSERVPTRLAFFQFGADECLTVTQDLQEALARIKAVLRRTQTNPPEEVLRLGEVELNLTSYTLKVSGREVPLTSKELDLLYVFLSSQNRVLSRPYLIERVWGYNYFGSPRTVDVHVRRLRQKLAKAARFITTIPCVGYKLTPPGRG